MKVNTNDNLKVNTKVNTNDNLKVNLKVNTKDNTKDNIVKNILLTLDDLDISSDSEMSSDNCQ